MQTAKSAEVQATYKDIKQTLGILPTFLKNYPEGSISGAWLDFKGLQLNATSVLPGKIKELIGLAVAAQIPCQYCTLLHTEAAKLNKANALSFSSKELIEAFKEVSNFSKEDKLRDLEFPIIKNMYGNIDKVLLQLGIESHDFSPEDASAEMFRKLL